MYQYLLLILIGICVPIIIFSICLKMKHTYYNIVFYIIILCISIFENIFFHNIYYGINISLKETVYNFIRNDSIIILYFLWIPSMISCILLNVFYYFNKNPPA